MQSSTSATAEENLSQIIWIDEAKVRSHLNDLAPNPGSPGRVRRDSSIVTKTDGPVQEESDCSSTGQRLHIP